MSTGTNDLTEPGVWPTVGLVASRELSVRLRSKSTRIATLVLMVIIIGLPVVLKLVTGSASTENVGLTGATASLGTAVQASGQAAGQHLNVTTVSDQARGEQQVRNGKLDALLVANGHGQLVAVVKKTANKGLTSAFTVLAQQAVFSQQITVLGGDPQRVRAAVNDAHITVQSLEPAYKYQTQQLVLGLVAGVLIYLSLLVNGQLVAQGVVEEKSSRVVELLLSAIRPWQLMVGKVLGIGTVGLIQMVVIGAAGIVTGLATGVLTISVSAAASTLAWLVVWYLLGFFMYATAFAGLGALVSRQEEVSGVVTPAMIFVIAGYVLGATVLPTNPANPIIETLSIIPVFAPTLMPMRLSMGGVPGWEAALAVALVLATIPLLVWLAGRIYRNAVLRTGARVRLSQALRAA
ncbi:MAG TPA: ABC transporter permease [Pseudonocardiaceae bacterium]|jgi:ABC-2 type transport system permease protein|nr:ABC transporter permease [Pseudonocardiaceae bacterium]